MLMHPDGVDVEVVVHELRERDGLVGWPARFSDWPNIRNDGNALCHVFQTREFISYWVMTIGKALRARAFAIGVFEKGNRQRPILFLGLALRRTRGLSVLRFIDGDVSDYNGPVLFPWTPEFKDTDIDSVLKDALAQLPHVDVIKLEKMVSEVQGKPNPLRCLGVVKEDMGGNAATLADDWDAFVERRVSRPKRHVRYLRSLKRQHSLAYEAIDTVGDVAGADKCLTTMFRQKARRFEETRVPGFEAGDGKTAFYRQFTADHQSRAAVHLSQILVDDEPIACQWGICFGTRYYYLICSNQTGEWAKYSPGRLINEGMLKWCYENNMAVADFGIGDEPYKFEYCDERIALYGFTRALTIKGRASLTVGMLMSGMRQTRLYQRLRPLKWVVLRRLKARAGASLE